MTGRTSIIAGIVLTAAAASCASFGEADLRWRGFDDQLSGTHVEYPATIFSVLEATQSRGRPGQAFGTEDGRAHLAVFAVHNPTRSSTAAFIARNLRVPTSTLHYERTTPSFFVVSGVHDNNIFYARCNASSDHAVFHCVNLVYPASDKRRWDPIVTRISRTLRTVE